ncbi:aminotransferase-like domain-containing protein [Pseudomonas sp. SDO528_S397]
MTVKTYIDTVSILQAGLSSGQGVKYKRLCDAMERGILDGLVEPGRKLPPHRILAHKLGVTVGTISRAYGELERLGLVVARVGDGTFVRERGMERRRDEGFRNFLEEPRQYFDMSRNMHIPGQETALLAQSLQALASDPRRLQAISGYTPDAGWVHHRAAGAQWLAQAGFTPLAEQVICVNGGQHGLLCTMMALLRAGDTVVTEQLTYPGLITVARMLGVRLIGLDMDEQGLLPVALEEACRVHRVAAVYCTPTIQNPTTAVQSVARREALVEVCREHNLLIFEDEAHGVLVADRPPPLSHFAPERTVLLSSLSKAVSAGLRVGYVHAPTALVSRITAALRSTCWMATPMTLEVAAQWIEEGTARHLLHQQINEIRRRKALVEGLLAGLQYRSHPDSPHFWITLPPPWRASEIEAQLKQNNYLIATAEAFAVGQAAVPQCVRVSVCSTSADDRALQHAFKAVGESFRC